MKSILIGFWSPFHGQTCNTSNAVAIATRIAVTRTFKSLLMHNTINKSNMENAFFSDTSTDNDISSIFDESGIDATMKLAKTGHLNPVNFKNYTNILIQERLEILLGTARKDGAVKELMLEQIEYIINCARDAYDFVFLDINAGHGELSLKTLELVDMLIISLNQNMEVLSSYFLRKEWDPVLENKPHILVMSNYDDKSTFNIERIRKEFNYYGEMYPIPRNVRFMDFYNEHKILDYFTSTSTLNKKEAVNKEEFRFFNCLDEIIKRIIHVYNLDDMSTFNPLEQRTIFDKMFGIFR